MEKSRLASWAALAGFIAVCLGTGALGGWITADSVKTWYPTLNKPSWNPPDWVFAPVWTTLYVMMAVAAWLVWKKDVRFSGVRAALILFFVQLALNLMWSALFFGARSPGLALMEIAVLWLAVAATLYAFISLSRPAGLLLIPYLAWVSFATVLNFSIWRLN
ncbi:MAG: TspO/MBR family protein [Aestuariivirga sp.]